MRLAREIARRSCFEQRDDLLGRLVDAEYHDADPLAHGAHRAHDPWPVVAGEIHQRDIGPVPIDELGGVSGIRSDRHDIEVALAAKGRTHSIAVQTHTDHDHHPDRGRLDVGSGRLG